MVPFGSFALSMVLLVVLMPSALRPPPDPATTSAEFSPDAPPDEQQDSIVAALNRGSTGTAGSGTGEGPSDQLGDGPAPAAPLPLPSRGRCFGNPPRQTESVYSPPCAPAFVGDNGGRTAAGVDANEVRIAIITGPLSTGQRASYEGRIRSSPDPSETAQDRTYRVLQAYFNARYELYGRRIQLIHVRPGSGEAGQRAAVHTAKGYDVFGVVGQGAAMQEEAARLGIVGFGTYQNPRDWYVDLKPYQYSWNIDFDQLVEFSAELLCKQIVGKPATFTDAPDINGKPRKLGFVVYEDEFRVGFGPMMKRRLKEECDEPLDPIVTYNLDTDADETQSQNLGTAITQMKAAGVTTVGCLCDFVTPIALLDQATKQGYYPEWYMGGGGEMDRNGLAALYDKSQWRHAFGITANEMARPDEEKDGYRAYKEMEPATNPHDGTLTYMFDFLQQLVGGLQLAGPKLTPDTFYQGMLRWPRRPPSPRWAVAGGYSPTDLTLADYVSLVWWDPIGVDASTENAPSGAYRHVFEGRRFARGEIPTEPVPFFQEGIAQPSEASDPSME